ncbi:uncharacterized protein LOC126824012 [Patella vulgata]|uniref:uncharacterized protein LOC126824012 n=1 Tax=Patella vulgata TaxID=6465 RepID=UPI0021809914|nr:uncharacterized protein LOC126824012 [Patella vulgata]
MHPYFVLAVCVAAISPLVKVSHAMDNLQCYDWKGNAVADGQKYIPNKDDPCMECTCSKGFRIMCTSVACSPPGNCALWEQIDGVCCEYKCIRSGEGNNVQGGGTNYNASHPDHDGGTATDDESITNLGLRLVASTVTSFLVLALLLFMVHRLRQRRLLLAMRRFEAQARRQQLEETDSDHYIPETFLGIECPPYEDPPPPYSPPKPHPRILPGEAPPPYEEIDQNPLSPLNNNEINRAITEGNGVPTPRQCSGMQNTDNNDTELTTRSVQTSAMPNVECRIESEELRRGQNVGEVANHGGVCVLPDFNGLMHTYISGNLNAVPQNRTRNSYLGNNDNYVSQTSPTGAAPLLCSSVHSDLRDRADYSCDEDQTMLKRCYSPEQEEQTTNFANSASFHQQSPLLGISSAGHCDRLPMSSAQAAQVMSASLTENSDSRRIIHQFDRFTSLPRQIRPSTEFQRVSNHFPGNESAETPQEIPLVNMKRSGSQEQANSCSQTPLRTAADGASRQDLLRSNLQPLTLSDKVTPLCSNIMVPNHGQASSVQSSEARLRNLRLSNLMNSPTKQLDAAGSPVTPDGQPMRRSQSMTSEISIFSVCSETGEVKLPKLNGNLLRSDSQYPDIPVRPHPVRQQTNPCEPSQTSSEPISKPVSADTQLAQREVTPDVQRADNSSRSGLQAIEENQSSVGEGDVGGPIGATALIQNFNKLNTELKEKSKKKDKVKVNRYSTGSLPVQKPKKVRQVGPSCESKIVNEVSKKHEGSRRKALKPSGLLKQYGFIDDNNSAGPKNNPVKIESRKVDSKDPRFKRDSEHQRTKLDVPIYCDSTVLQATPECVPARSGRTAAIKPGVKRQLNYSDKTSHSPSPTRHKSRPKSMFPSFNNKEAESGAWNDLSKDPSTTCVPRRKNKSSTSRNKKRQSYPATNIQSAENTGIVLSRPNILASVMDATNEIVCPVSESAAHQNTTLLNGYVYKYNTDSKSHDNGNVYVKLRPTSLSSYV